MAFRHWLIHQCTIETESGTAVYDTGEPVEDWQAAATAVACRFVQKDERYAAEGDGELVRHIDTILFPAGTVVDANMRVSDITLSADGSTVDAGPFQVTAVMTRNSNRVRHISAKLERVGNG